MNFAKAVATVSSMTILSRISGFVRDTLSANILGAGPVADAFFVALRIPNLFRSLFAEGAFSAAFVPLYAKAKKEGGEALAKVFSGEALAILSAVLVPFTIAMILVMPWAMHVFAPGFENRPATYDLAVLYAQITFPYLFLVSGVALLTGVLNSNHAFAPGAAAPVAFNLIAIFALMIARPLKQDPGLMLAIAVPVSGVIQWLWMKWHCKKLGVDPPLLAPKLSPLVKNLFKNVGPGALGAGAAQVNLAMSTILASLLPTGSVSYLFYADRLNQLPLGIVGIAISSTLLPILSARVQKEDKNGVRHYTTRALEFGLVLGLPAALGLSFSALPIITVLFQHGAFKEMDSHGTALALAAYSIGVVPFILVKVLSSLFFAHHDTRTPVRVAILSVVSNIILSLALLYPLGHVGIALATSIAAWINGIFLTLALKRANFLILQQDFMLRMLRIIGSAAVMGAALYFAAPVAMDYIKGHGKFEQIGVLSLYLLAATFLYMVALLATKAVSIKEIRKILTGKDDE